MSKIKALKFIPNTSTLQLWSMLPQESIPNHPKLLGSIKSSAIHYIIFLILIITEIALFYLTHKEGVPILVLIILVLIDIVLGIGLSVFFYYSSLIINQIEASIYIINRKITLDYAIPENYKGNKERYIYDLLQDVKSFRNKKNKILLVQALFLIIIILSGLWKIYSIYSVMELSLFFSPVGRAILTIIIYSIFVHIYTTPKVFLYIWYNYRISNEMKKLKFQPNLELKCIQRDILFHYEFKETSGENSIKKWETQHSESINKMSKYYINYKGLLTDMDIAVMAQTQDDAQNEAIISTCKEIQLNQLIGH